MEFQKTSSLQHGKPQRGDLHPHAACCSVLLRFIAGAFYLLNPHALHKVSGCMNLSSEKIDLKSRFFQQPDDAKQALPKVDWAKAEVIGFERNNLSGKSSAAAVSDTAMT